MNKNDLTKPFFKNFLGDMSPKKSIFFTFPRIMYLIIRLALPTANNAKVNVATAFMA